MCTSPPSTLFVVRHRGTVDAIAPVIGKAVADVDADLPIVAMSTMNARLALVTELETMIVRLLACFAVLSLIIASLGHYAVAAFNIRRRTREFGVRMALGASAQRIKAAVVREALVHTAPGLAIGLALSAALANPIDMVRTRIHAQAGGVVRYASTLAAAAAIVSGEGGVGALYRGLGITLLRTLPNTGIQFGVYEACKDILSAYDLYDGASGRPR